MTKKTLNDININQKKVLTRVDFNVPLDNGTVADDNRIIQALPTIREIIDRDGQLILMSHLGRPGGEFDASLSLEPVANYLRDLLDAPVHFASNCIGEQAETTIEEAQPGEVILLENTRFHPGEKQNDPAFCKQLASLGDVFVNNAFGTSHRAHASVTGVAAHLKPAVAGFLLENEIKNLSKVTENPSKPYAAVIGGAKISDKINVIEHLIDQVDSILIGGGMTYTFYKAQGMEIGDSLVEDNKLDLAKQLLQTAEQSKTKLVLPLDSVVADDFDNDANQQVITSDDAIDDGWSGLDIGPQTSIAYGNLIKQAETAIWFGPMGVYEMENFADGTNAIAQALADATKQDATTLVGGGDSAAAIRNASLEDQVTHVSTGGGASLMFLEGKELPGIAALDDASNQ